MPLIPVIQMNIREAYHNWLANNPEKFEGFLKLKVNYCFYNIVSFASKTYYRLNNETFPDHPKYQEVDLKHTL